MIRQEKIRVLHLVTNFSLGGIEKLVHDLSVRIDHVLFELDICCVGCAVGPLLDSVKSSGVAVYSFGHYRRNPWFFYSGYHDLLRSRSYHVIHSHLNQFSWLFLRYPCVKLETPLRIVHYHNDFSSASGDKNVRCKNVLRRISRRLTDRYANCVLGISEAALDSVYESNWKSRPYIHRLYNGVPLESFGNYDDKRDQRRLELGIRPGTFVIGHVGRFRPQKNHMFIVRLAERLCLEIPECKFLLVGDGPLLEEIKQHVREHGIEKNFIFTGARTDIADLLLIMDIFVFPSLWEGFPLSPIEAQASGLPVVLSEESSMEVPLVPPSKRISLENLDLWVDSCRELSERPIDPVRIVAPMQKQLADFSIDTWVSRLEQLYLDAF